CSGSSGRGVGGQWGRWRKPGAAGGGQGGRVGCKRRNATSSEGSSLDDMPHFIRSAIGPFEPQRVTSHKTGVDQRLPSVGSPVGGGRASLAPANMRSRGCNGGCCASKMS